MSTVYADQHAHDVAWMTAAERAEYKRRLTPQRQAQGFRSQAHLDAFYAAYDHTKSCAECQRPGPAMWLEGSASWQPTQNRCAEGKRLDVASFDF